MTPPVDISPHAFDRANERWNCDEATLRELLPSAQFVEYERGSKQEIWVTDTKMLLVVLDGVVRTVLPPNATRPEGRRVR